MTSSTANSLPPNAVAVIGMAGRFPGANSVAEFWRNLAADRESIVSLSEEDLLAAGVTEKALANHSYVRRAALLDGTSADYSAAVGAARGALQNPDETPSAKLIRELKGTGASFLEYALGVARQHRDYFGSLPLDRAKEDLLEATAARSLADAAALEAEDGLTFEEYLRRYSELP